MQTQKGILQQLMKKLIYIAWSAFMAYGYYSVTIYIFFNVTGQNVLAASIWNLSLLLAFLLLDKIIELLYIKYRKQLTSGRSIPMRMLNAYLNSASMKSALYLFYVIILICTAILAAEPDFPALVPLSGYFLSTRYGILLLIAADKFLEQITKDIKKDADLNETKQKETPHDLQPS
ncbi:MAG: hypothetical protein FWB76_07170 [Oscillospiraceae bacterium]|nr:hypothetical protein [Oscillospiraceae bacterium]